MPFCPVSPSALQGVERAQPGEAREVAIGRAQRGPVLDRPVFHRAGHGVGYIRVGELSPLLDRLLQYFEHRFRQLFAISPSSWTDKVGGSMPQVSSIAVGAWIIADSCALDAVDVL